jgi:hypothetical protein
VRILLAAVALLGVTGCAGYYGRTASGGDTAPAQWLTSNASTAGRAPGGTPRSTEERLRNLTALRRDGLISEAELRERRRQILDESF